MNSNLFEFHKLICKKIVFEMKMIETAEDLVTYTPISIEYQIDGKKWTLPFIDDTPGRAWYHFSDTTIAVVDSKSDNV
jgi:hypothetical protein